MENLIEKLNAIAEEFRKIENVTDDQFCEFKNKEFELFDKIETIKEISEYYKTDMTIDGMDPQFISGFYSGVINGSIFVINAIKEVLSSENVENAQDVINNINEKLELIQGLK